MDFRVRKEIMPGVFLTYVPTGKFKTCYMSISLLRNLKKEEAAKNALLPKVLSRGTAIYPDMEKISAQLDDLYGTNLVPVVRKKGEVQCVGFASTFIDDTFSEDKELLEKVMELTGQMLLMPATQGGRFVPEYVDSEKIKLSEEISSIINDKRQYSVRQLIGTMCAGEPYGVPNTGSEAAVQAITGSKLYKHYAEVTAHSRIEVFYCGSADIGRVSYAVEKALSSLPRGEKVAVVSPVKIIPGEISYKIEETDASQSNLAIGFRTNCTVADKDYPALLMLNAVFGGAATSKLFMNVREKLSLCYYASSSLLKHKGLVLVTSGIDAKNYQQALDEIMCQFDAVRRGEIEDWELESARRGIIGSLKGMKDAPGRLEDFYLSHAVEGLEYSPDYLIEEVEKVTLENIIEAAEKTVADTVFFLKGNAQ